MVFFIYMSPFFWQALLPLSPLLNNQNNILKTIQNSKKMKILIQTSGNKTRKTSRPSQKISNEAFYAIVLGRLMKDLLGAQAMHELLLEQKLATVPARQNY